MEHPVVAGDKSLLAEAEKASDALYRFYNVAAGKLMASAAAKKPAKAGKARREKTTGETPVPRKGG